MTTTRHLLIDGKDVPAASGRTTPDINPFTNETYALAAAAEVGDVTASVDAAQVAFATWSTTKPSERMAILTAAADLLQTRAEEFAQVLIAETGGTRTWARINTGATAQLMRHAATTALSATGELASTDRQQWSMAVREPAGVVAAIVPWNAPLVLCARAIVVALALGNTVVLRPSEDAPITSGLFLADVLRDAGLPPGVLNVITNDVADAPQIVETLIADPRVRRVNFTGSTGIGRIVGSLAAQHLKPAILELGGKNPIIVCADADIEQAVDSILYAKFMNSGQICLAVDRIILHQDIAEEFTAKFVAKAAALPHGDPSDPSTVVGPLINQRAADRVSALVDDAVGKGASVLLGGGKADGRVYPPTVLSGLTKDMRIYYEETFGPVASLYMVTDDTEAIELANDTEYGLSSAVFTRDGTRGLALARLLRHGATHVNNHTIMEEASAPMGGLKNSGYGVFGGQREVDFFTEVRWITVAQQAETQKI